MRMLIVLLSAVFCNAAASILLQSAARNKPPQGWSYSAFGFEVSWKFALAIASYCLAFLFYYLTLKHLPVATRIQLWLD